MSLERFLTYVQIILLISAATMIFVYPPLVPVLEAIALITLAFQIALLDVSVKVVSIGEEPSISPKAKLVVIFGVIVILILSQFISIPSDAINTAVTILISVLGINVGLTTTKLTE